MGCICFKEARRKAREDAEAHNSAMQHAASSPVHDLQNTLEAHMVRIGARRSNRPVHEVEGSSEINLQQIAGDGGMRAAQLNSVTSNVSQARCNNPQHTTAAQLAASRGIALSASNLWVQLGVDPGSSSHVTVATPHPQVLTATAYGTTMNPSSGEGSAARRYTLSSNSTPMAHVQRALGNMTKAGVHRSSTTPTYPSAQADTDLRAPMPWQIEQADLAIGRRDRALRQAEMRTETSTEMASAMYLETRDLCFILEDKRSGTKGSGSGYGPAPGSRPRPNNAQASMLQGGGPGELTASMVARLGRSTTMEGIKTWLQAKDFDGESDADNDTRSTDAGRSGPSSPHKLHNKQAMGSSTALSPLPPAYTSPRQGVHTSPAAAGPTIAKPPLPSAQSSQATPPSPTPPPMPFLASSQNPLIPTRGCKRSRS